MIFVATIFWALVMWLAVALAAAVPAWLLWNWLMPVIFGLPALSLMQAFGLLVLSSLFFGSRPKFKFEN